VNAIVIRWKKALENLEDQTRALDQLLDSIGNSPERLSLIEQYKQQMVDAHLGSYYPGRDPKQRHPTKMDMYNMTLMKCKIILHSGLLGIFKFTIG
jgi:hypothetical protein